CCDKSEEVAMNSARSGKSHAMVWATMVVLVPVLYVLSWGPVHGMQATGKIDFPPHPLVSMVYRPLGWTRRWQPIDDFLYYYGKWWVDTLWKPGDPRLFSSA